MLSLPKLIHLHQRSIYVCVCLKRAKLISCLYVGLTLRRQICHSCYRNSVNLLTTHQAQFALNRESRRLFSTRSSPTLAKLQAFKGDATASPSLNELIVDRDRLLVADRDVVLHAIPATERHDLPTLYFSWWTLMQSLLLRSMSFWLQEQPLKLQITYFEISFQILKLLAVTGMVVCWRLMTAESVSRRMLHDILWTATTTMRRLDSTRSNAACKETLRDHSPGQAGK
jgi:hypothetical protein